MKFRRRLILAAASLLAAGLFNTIPAHAQSTAREILRIGYQKYGTLTLLKGQGTLEKRLAPRGIEVKWVEFPAGPQLLEALNVGSIDFGTVGEAPPIFAQAAGARLVYVGNEPPAPAGEAIIVPRNSALKSVAELKGKKVALNKGSNVHYLLVKALEKAGLQYADIQPVFLPPADARAAFERGSVDAWVIWDPFLAAAEKQIGARVLADGKGLVSNHQFYLAERGYADKRQDVVLAIFDELARTDEWARTHPKEAALLLAPQLGLDLPIVELAVVRFAYGVKPVTAQVIAEQQRIADVFADLKLIPKRLNVAEAAWQPRPDVAAAR